MPGADRPYYGEILGGSVKTDSKGKTCPFCLENGMVEVITDTRDAYLIQVVKGGSIAPGRYLIIPKEHIEWLEDRPSDWTEQENKLTRDAHNHAMADPHLAVRLERPFLLGALNMSWNQGEYAGQLVLHIHEWIIFRHDNLKIGLDGLIEQRGRDERRIAALEAELAGVRRSAGLQLNGL